MKAKWHHDIRFIQHSLNFFMSPRWILRFLLPLHAMFLHREWFLFHSGLCTRTKVEKNEEYRHTPGRIYIISYWMNEEEAANRKKSGEIIKYTLGNFSVYITFHSLLSFISFTVSHILCFYFRVVHFFPVMGENRHLNDDLLPTAAAACLPYMNLIAVIKLLFRYSYYATLLLLLRVTIIIIMEI